MARPGGGKMTYARRLSPGLRLLLVAGCLVTSVYAGLLAPEWSRPLTSPVISAAARPTESGTEELFLLLADRRVMVVSRLDTLTELGRAPEGTTALVALPGVGGGAGVPDDAAGETNASLLLAVRGAGSSDIIAWNRRGQPLWKTPAPGLRRVDSLSFIDWYEGRPELCVWQQGEPWLVVAGSDQVHATRLQPGFIPLDALILDFAHDRTPELIFFDGRRLAIVHPRQNRELRCQWPDSPSGAGGRGSGGQGTETRSPKPIVACAVFDSIPVLLVLTGDTLRYVDIQTGAEERRFVPDSSSGLPGAPRAVCAAGAAAYVAGDNRQGGGYIAALGRPSSSLIVHRASFAGAVYGLAMLKDWPMALVNVGYGPENFRIYAPNLAGATGNSPGYSGVRLLRVLPLRLDDDTFPDLVVLRTAADARWRVDAFTNHLGLLARELDQAQQALQHAVLGRDGNEVIRAARRVNALTAEIGPGAAAPETHLLERYRLEARRRGYITYAVVLLALCLAAGLGVLAVRRRHGGPPGQQIENKPLPVCVALAADFIAADHNFISKGNTPAAIERLIEISRRHGLARDRDLARLATEPGPSLGEIYTSAISRLIDSTPTLALLDFIATTARSAPRGRDLEMLELSQEEFRHRERGPGIRLICTVNHEYPDYYRRFRLFSNPELRGTLEHIILDHIRHAGTWADIVLSYTVNTQWNRRLLIRLLSDSPRVIPLSNPRAHITSQLLELAAQLGPAIEIPAADSPCAGPHEKLWLKVTDYISVLEETRARFSTP